MATLSHTQSLFNHVYWFKNDLTLTPNKDHIGSAIQWSDIIERKDDFLKELVNTIVSWVYNNEACKKIIDERLEITNNDYGNANNFLTNQAYLKFRPGKPQGQFGELLLYNFIQHFFKAVPILRKQRIATSIGFERFGADAIHFKIENNQNVFILGESKCYSSDYQFKNAFKSSLESIIDSVKNFSKELDLYIFDDFIEPELEKIAKLYKQNKLQNFQLELVCLIAYAETKDVKGKNENEIRDSIREIIIERCTNLDKSCYDGIEQNTLARLNYIIFPIWELDNLLKKFMNKVGSTL